MIAHELRRPLTALLGALATVQQRGPALATAQQQELVGIAHAKAPSCSGCSSSSWSPTAWTGSTSGWSRRRWSMRPRWPPRPA
jgi:signal transduction histidine kinase